MQRLKLYLFLPPKCMAHWIFKFLSNRRGEVEINEIFGEELHVCAGFPWSRVLAPTLFTL